MVKELNINYEDIDLSVLNNFVTITKKLDDKRVQYKIRHNMSDIVIIALLGILLGMKFTVLLSHTKHG